MLNPLRRVDEHIMDDADLAGPIFFIFCFAMSLLFVSDTFMSVTRANYFFSPESPILITYTVSAYSALFPYILSST